MGWEGEEEVIKNSFRAEEQSSGESRISEAKVRMNTKKRADCSGYTELLVKESNQLTAD